MKYSILILTLLMFCITGRSQVASGQEDRAYWISVLSQVADPLLDNMSKGELRKSMPVRSILLMHELLIWKLWDVYW